MKLDLNVTLCETRRSQSTGRNRTQIAWATIRAVRLRCPGTQRVKASPASRAPGGSQGYAPPRPHLGRSPADPSFPSRLISPALLPPGPLTFQKAVLQLPERAGTARRLLGPRRASRQPQPGAPEPPGRRRGLIRRLRVAPHLSRHPTDSPLGSGQSPPHLGPGS